MMNTFRSCHLIFLGTCAAALLFIGCATQKETRQRSVPVPHESARCPRGDERGPSLVEPVAPEGLLADLSTNDTHFADVKQRAARIVVGMKRSEVEQMFRTKDGGISPIGVTRYYEHPRVKIEVGFDQTGGTVDDDNRVTGTPRVYRQQMYCD